MCISDMPAPHSAIATPCERWSTLPSESRANSATQVPLDLGAGTAVLTGAGVSTDSGIPDYRGPGAPVRRPMTFSQFRGSAAARQRYWARAYLGWDAMVAAQPNESHTMLAGLARTRGLAGLITQNVDGLHTEAGQPDVIDLHGRLDRVICLDCRQVTSRDWQQNRLRALNPGFTADNVERLPDGDVALEETEGFDVAACGHCGGALKPDVVFFGENAPKDRVQRCHDLVDSAESLLVLGSSLAVWSGLRFVKQAHRRDIPIVIVNHGATRGDEYADVKIEAGCAQTLRQWLGSPELIS